MKIHHLSIVGGATGIVLIIISLIRWFLMWYDPSQAILFSFIGAIIFIFSYIYNWMRNIEIDYQKLEKRLNDFSTWMTKEELK
jgi:H+/Cl- antiporter ClcA